MGEACLRKSWFTNERWAKLKNAIYQDTTKAQQMMISAPGFTYLHSIFHYQVNCVEFVSLISQALCLLTPAISQILLATSHSYTGVEIWSALTLDISNKGQGNICLMETDTWKPTLHRAWVYLPASDDVW